MDINWNICYMVINVSCYSLKVKVISLHNTTSAKVCVKLFATTCNFVLAVLFHFHYNFAGIWSWENIQLDNTKVSNKMLLELTLFHMRFVTPIIWCEATQNIIWSSLGSLSLDFQKVYTDGRKEEWKEGTQLYVNRRSW